jgi:hypothetical protein
VAKATASRPGWELVRATWREHGGDLRRVFATLNWGNPTVQAFKLDTGGSREISITPLASLKNFHAFEVELPPDSPTSLIRELQKEITKSHPDYVLVMKGSKQIRFEWPRRRPDGGIKFDAFTTSLAEPHQLTCQKLSGVSFTVSELGNATLEDVRSRVYGLASEGVTKRFYERFRDEHDNLAQAIHAKSDLSDSARHSYSSLLLNRLMFVYFLQKKEFLSGNPHLLNDALKTCEANSKNYYRDALLPLFFEGFNGQSDAFSDTMLIGLWGSIPYINGGIFAPHGLELEASLEIPNSAFAQVFAFFDLFDWHLDARPLGTTNEINPEVLGYIFEQYINYSADGKKDNGAYYTPEDVTGFMVAQTLLPRILDDFVKIWPNTLEIVRANPAAYIHSAMLHGAISTHPLVWAKCPEDVTELWHADPECWGELDVAPTDDGVCLPGESWVEMFYRREKTDSLLSQLLEFGVSDVNELITRNLNASKLISDTIGMNRDSESLASAWHSVSQISVIDPTCGSGAFLFAALTSLESIYEDLYGAIVAGGGPIPSIVLDSGVSGTKVRYQIRKHISMKNLYGTDIMADAIETAKLRIFLSLAAVLDDVSDLEPLPDLDFNLKTGNLVVGLSDMDDAQRITPPGTFGAVLYDFTAIQVLTESFNEQFKAFKSAEISHIAKVPELKGILTETQRQLRNLVNEKYLEIATLDKNEISAWVQRAKPFNWFAEFPAVMERGGFDVVIGNPPYINLRKKEARESIGSETLAAIQTFATANCPDFYAVCFERSLQLLHPHGRHAFIVMTSLAFSDQFKTLRGSISQRSGAEWWSTFGKRPDALFRGVQVRNALVVLGPGKGAYSTRHHLFSPDSRPQLFSTIDYFENGRDRGEIPIRAGVAAGLARAIAATPEWSKTNEGHHVFIRPTGQYWFPVVPQCLPLLGLDGQIVEKCDQRLHRVDTPHNSTKQVATALLAGKISYLWWGATGDDFDFLGSQANKVLGLLANLPLHGLQGLGASVHDAALDFVFGTTNAGKVQLNIRWKSARGLTDQFDRQLLVELGLEHEWRNLNVWYRQAMKAGRDNTNSTNFSRGQIEKLLRELTD